MKTERKSDFVTKRKNEDGKFNHQDTWIDLKSIGKTCLQIGNIGVWSVFDKKFLTYLERILMVKGVGSLFFRFGKSCAVTLSEVAVFTSSLFWPSL